MEFTFSAAEEKIAEEVHDFIEKEITPELLAETEELGGIYGGTEARKIVQKIGARGWLCPTWPEEYGGIECSEILKCRIFNDMTYMGMPYAFVGAGAVGPAILKHGSNDMKKRFLLPIARGQIEFALGYTEPQAGSDLASLEIRAEDKGEYFLVNGQKMFNTHAHVAEYHWLAVRTDPNAPKKYQGISLMIVDMKSPGISISPMTTMSGEQTNEVFYDNVKVPKTNLFGEVNRGFYYIMAALDFERTYTQGGFRRLFDELVEYTKETIIDGQPLSKNPFVRQKLAQFATELEAGEILYYRPAWLSSKGRVPSYEASMQKLFASEMIQRLANTGMQIMGFYGQLQRDSKWSPLKGKMEYHYRDSILRTIAAGTSEIQRNIIAQAGLGLPRR